MVAIFAGRCSPAKQPTVYGDGSQTRDYVFVDDVVDAFVRAAEKGGGLLMNIGTGIETSVLDLYDAMARLAGFPEPPRGARARRRARSARRSTRAGPRSTSVEALDPARRRPRHHRSTGSGRASRRPALTLVRVRSAERARSSSRGTAAAGRPT